MNILGFARQRLRQVDNLLRQERQDDRHICSRDCDIISFQFVICSRKRFLADLTPPKQEAIAECLTLFILSLQILFLIFIELLHVLFKTLFFI